MQKKYKVIMAVLATMAIMFMFTTGQTEAKTKTMTVYNEVIKDGNNVYCNGNSGLYRINLKSGKKKTYKRTPHPGDDGLISLKKKGSYLYYKYYDPIGSDLNRVNVNTGKKQKLKSKKDCQWVNAYVISGSKIYYRLQIDDPEDGNIPSKHLNYVMKLNGKAKKKTTVKVRNKAKKTNVKGWKIVETKGTKMIDGEEWEAYYEYLKTPKKRYYLGWYYW